MCTSIVEMTDIEGSARSSDGWFAVRRVVAAYDHPQHALLEEAILLDFVDHEAGAGARAPVELTLEAAKALQLLLNKVIDAAEKEEADRAQYVGPNHPHFGRTLEAAE